MWSRHVIATQRKFLKGLVAKGANVTPTYSNGGVAGGSPLCWEGRAPGTESKTLQLECYGGATMALYPLSIHHCFCRGAPQCSRTGAPAVKFKFTEALGVGTPNREANAGFQLWSCPCNFSGSGGKRWSLADPWQAHAGLSGSWKHTQASCAVERWNLFFSILSWARAAGQTLAPSNAYGKHTQAS